MPSLDNVIIMGFLLILMVVYQLQKAAKSVADNPEAKQIGLGFLRRFLGGK